MLWFVVGAGVAKGAHAAAEAMQSTIFGFPLSRIHVFIFGVSFRSARKFRPLRRDICGMPSRRLFKTTSAVCSARLIGICMRVYSYQSASVLAAIMSEEGYVPEWNHCNSCFKEHQTQFEPAYRWLATQYNVRKNTNYTNPPIWFYITAKQAKEQLLNSTGVLIIAEVPDEELLLYNSENWYAVLNNYSLGFLDSIVTYDFDRIFNIYAKESNKRAIEETWQQIFLKTKQESIETFHAITMRFKKEWIANL